MLDIDALYIEFLTAHVNFDNLNIEHDTARCIKSDVLTH